MTKAQKSLALLPIWVAMVTFGFSELWVYSKTAGEKARVQNVWPAQAELKPDSKTPHLVLFFHPVCPCSKAAAGELERLIAPLKDRVNITVYFYRPSGKPEAWVRQSLWEHVESLPEVTVRVDHGGAQALLFGAKTSGHAFLYAANGSLVFDGGLTPERGHMGDSPGREAVLSYVRKGQSPISRTDVFGCSFVVPVRATAEAADS